MKKWLFALLALFAVPSFAQNWTPFPTTAPSTTGATFTLTLSFVPTSPYTTYAMLVSDALTDNFSNGYSWTETSSIQIKDSSNNNVCSTPSSSSNAFGSTVTLYHFEQDCNSGTLTNGNQYTLTITGKAYYWGATVTKPPQLMVYLSAS